MLEPIVISPLAQLMLFALAVGLMVGYLVGWLRGVVEGERTALARTQQPKEPA